MSDIAQDLGGVVRLRKTLQVWRDMKQRCYNPRSRKFKNYGGRGISICPRWLESPELFIADMGLKPDGLTIDRINNDGNYEPSNCRWATKEQQGNNTRQCVYLELNGERMTVEAWAHKLGRHPETIRSRIRRGWALEDILSPNKIMRGPFPVGRSAMQQGGGGGEAAA